MDYDPNPKSAPAPRGLIAELLGRILAAHWLRHRPDAPNPAATVTQLPAERKPVPPPPAE